jgi:outer membrane protein assembly factor BamD (BamD/ComL family)
VELVENARKAVESGNSAEALQALDQHDRRFESGPLVHEARVLRIQALLKAGDYRAAEAAAHGFLAAYTDSPYEGRVRALLREAEQRRASEAAAPDARP